MACPTAFLPFGRCPEQKPSEHKDAVYFDETQPADNKTKAAYRELRLWQKGYLAAVAGGR